MATNTIKGSKIREIFGCACVPKPQPGDNEYLVEWEPSNIDALRYLGLWAVSDPSLAGITTLNILARSNSSAMIIGYASDLTTLNFPNLTTLTKQLDNNGYLYIEYNPVLTTINFPKLNSANQFDLYIDNNSNLTTVNFPLLNSFTGADFYINDNPNLTSVDLSSLNISSNTNIQIHDNPNLTTIKVPTILTGDSFNFSNNALNQGTVDSILQALVYSGVSDGGIDIAGGSNAVPNSTNVAILINRNWEIGTNQNL